VRREDKEGILRSEEWGSIDDPCIREGRRNDGVWTSRIAYLKVRSTGYCLVSKVNHGIWVVPHWPCAG
jgi:hypothetical protein